MEHPVVKDTNKSDAVIIKRNIQVDSIYCILDAFEARELHVTETDTRGPIIQLTEWIKPPNKITNRRIADCLFLSTGTQSIATKPCGHTVVKWTEEAVYAEIARSVRERQGRGRIE